jgi:hypothetical protein
MKTIAIVLCLLFCFISPVLAADNDFNGADGIIWQQHVSSLPFKLIKFDEMVMTDGSTVDLCFRENNPTLQRMPGIKSISYLFKNSRFIGIIYELRDEVETASFILALMGIMGDPDKVTPENDKSKEFKALWVRRVSIAFAVTSERAVLLGERAAMAEVIKKWGARENI